VCGDFEWTIEHTGGHYLHGSREIMGCLCSQAGTKQAKAAWKKKRAKAGKVVAKTIAPKRRPETKPKPSHNAVTTPQMARKAAEGLARGLSVKQALEEAGYSPSMCNSGWRRVNLTIQTELRRIASRYIKTGQQLTAEDQQNAIRGRLYENVVRGVDKGVMSAKVLGSDKRISMWQADSQVGVVVLQGPAVRQIGHEVEILPPSRFAEQGGVMIEQPQHEEPKPPEEPIDPSPSGPEAPKPTL
jgi:hypothetical protein